MKKEYQNIGAMRVNLVKNKNVDETTIIDSCLNEKTYLDLITPFSNLLAIGRDSKNKHIYDANMSFNDYVELNIIDATVCAALQTLIGCFEKRLKNFLMHAYCSKIKNNGDKQTKEYTWIDQYLSNQHVFDLVDLDKDKFNGVVIQASKDTVDRRKEVLNIIKNTTTTNSQKSIIIHYKQKYGYIPMFIAIHVLSLGQLLTLYNILPTKDKNTFMCDFNRNYKSVYTDKQIQKFEKDIKRINVVRNIVNHYESIFPFIENTDGKTFQSLVDTFKKLKFNYDNSTLVAPYNFAFNKTIHARNSYSLGFHLKIEKVISALK